MKTFTSYKIEEQHAGLPVEAYLKEILGYSGRKIQKLTRKKGILLNKRSVFLQKNLKTGDLLQVAVLEDASYGVQPEAGGVDILYEDEYLLVLNKPPYQLVHPAGHTTHGTLANHLAYHWQQQGLLYTLRPIHRLDRDTSGCILFAKDAQSQFKLEEQLKSRQISRLYQACVTGLVQPPQGIITAGIAVHPHRPNRRIVSDQGESAITHYRTLQQFPVATLLELELETGRTHQIRLHLAHLGHPVIGDAMYGKPSPFMPRQALHAVSVTFSTLGDNRRITVQAPLPTDFRQLLDHCGLTPTNKT
ncbi:RluA family pseudouridine synthase [Propionispora hippei]|uniref:Pseudouridine synthase n=1 Tax=Propionispora hippei DSM 15287 TaxID=1123003 RepID=A0A1M6CPA9_9FIRM|nr:RluA family pseudouridine synthase [Propionispora hippei]SHI62872.1 23S rRNA pseudouridine1911/1915/1917 synthase [Propionispora hippei DSM 15287]